MSLNAFPLTVAVVSAVSSILNIAPDTLSQTAPIVSPQSAQAATANEPSYDTYMRLGYAASEKKNYQDAANYFRSALFHVPDDRAARIAYWNSINALKEAQTISDRTPVESDYDRYMRLGYEETQSRDYQSALINFNRALEQRPGDYFATEAIRNGVFQI